MSIELNEALAVSLIISASLQVSDVIFEVVEGDARNVLCEAVERHHASVLVVGSHGYGAIKRFFSFLSNDLVYLNYSVFRSSALI